MGHSGGQGVAVQCGNFPFVYSTPSSPACAGESFTLAFEGIGYGSGRIGPGSGGGQMRVRVHRPKGSKQRCRRGRVADATTSGTSSPRTSRTHAPRPPTLPQLRYRSPAGVEAPYYCEMKTRTWYCGVGGCGKAYDRMNSLEYHLLATHIQERPYVCRYDRCELGFYQECDRKRHEVRHHGASKGGEGGTNSTAAPSAPAFARRKKKRRPRGGRDKAKGRPDADMALPSATADASHGAFGSRRAVVWSGGLPNSVSPPRMDDSLRRFPPSGRAPPPPPGLFRLPARRAATGDVTPIVGAGSASRSSGAGGVGRGGGAFGAGFAGDRTACRPFASRSPTPTLSAMAESPPDWREWREFSGELLSQPLLNSPPPNVGGVGGGSGGRRSGSGGGVAASAPRQRSCSPMAASWSRSDMWEATTCAHVDAATDEGAFSALLKVRPRGRNCEHISVECDTGFGRQVCENEAHKMEAPSAGGSALRHAVSAFP